MTSYLHSELLVGSCPMLAHNLGLEDECCPSCIFEIQEVDEWGGMEPHAVEVDGREVYPCCKHVDAVRTRSGEENT